MECSREARRCLEFLDEYEGASDEHAGGTLNRITGWLCEDQGDPDDDLERAEKMIKQAIRLKGQGGELLVNAKNEAIDCI